MYLVIPPNSDTFPAYLTYDDARNHALIIRAVTNGPVAIIDSHELRRGHGLEEAGSAR